MEILSALLAICEGNPPIVGEAPSQTPVTRSLDIFFDLRLNNQLRKHSRHRWFGTPSRSCWRHCNDYSFQKAIQMLLSCVHKKHISYKHYSYYLATIYGHTLKLQSILSSLRHKSYPKLFITCTWPRSLLSSMSSLEGHNNPSEIHLKITIPHAICYVDNDPHCYQNVLHILMR